MTIQNTTTAELPLISETQEQAILDGLHTLYGAVMMYGKPLPAFAEVSADPDQRERVIRRATVALKQLHNARREALVARFRSGVNEIVAPYIEVQSAAREQFLALDKSVRQFLPPFPTSVYVPLEAVKSVFPEGTQEAHMVSMLHTLKFRVSKKDGKSYLAADLPIK